jgi:hypothetical protein
MRSALFSNSKLDIKYKYQACFRVQIDNESGVEWLFAKKKVFQANGLVANIFLLMTLK